MPIRSCVSPSSAATANDPQDRAVMDISDSEDELVRADLQKKEHSVQHLNGLRVYFYGLDDVKRRVLEGEVLAYPYLLQLKIVVV